MPYCRVAGRASAISDPGCWPLFFQSPCSVALAHPNQVLLYGSGTHRLPVSEHLSYRCDCDVRAVTGQRDSLYDLSLIHISEPTRLGMNSYAVFCLKKK